MTWLRYWPIALAAAGIIASLLVVLIAAQKSANEECYAKGGEPRTEQTGVILIGSPPHPYPQFATYCIKNGVRI